MKLANNNVRKLPLNFFILTNLYKKNLTFNSYILNHFKNIKIRFFFSERLKFDFFFFQKNCLPTYWNPFFFFFFFFFFFLLKEAACCFIIFVLTYLVYLFIIDRNNIIFHIPR